MTTKNFSTGEALKFGWGALTKNIGIWVSLIATVVGVVIVFSVLQMVAEAASPAFSILLSIVAFIVQIIVTAGFIKISLAFVDGTKPAVADLFNSYPLVFRFFAVSILYMLITLAGLLLFVVPGIVWSIKFRFCTYFVVDKNMRPVEALKASAQLTHGAKWELFGFLIVGGIVNLLGTLAVYVGLIVTAPIVLVATAYVYRQLLAQTKPAAPLVPPTPSPTLQ